LAFRASQRCSVCDRAKIFHRSKFSYLFLWYPPYKTQIVTGNGWETTNSKPPGPIIIFGQSENKDQHSTHIYYIPSWQVHSVDCLFRASANCATMLAQNHFPPPKGHLLTVLHPVLLCRVPYWRQLGMLFYRLHDI
jgi:hypothetical protein